MSLYAFTHLLFNVPVDTFHSDYRNHYVNFSMFSLHTSNVSYSLLFLNFEYYIRNNQPHAWCSVGSYIYIYIYMCVCVCVCKSSLITKYFLD